MSVEGDIEALETKYRELTKDIDPQELREYVRQLLGDANHTPAVLALLAGEHAGVEPPSMNEVAGLQFVHHGLRITHDVLHDESWIDPGPDPTEEDMLLLCADVLVATGFDNLLDHYDRITEIVNDFGTNEARLLDQPGHMDYGAEEYVDTYRTAVRIGDPAPAEQLLELAEKLAYGDHAADNDGDPGPHYTEADRIVRNLGSGLQPYLDRIKARKRIGRREGIEVQD